MVNRYIIEKLREGRLNKGLKQSDVTRLTGIKNTTLSNYENGNTEPDMDTFLKLCHLYELDYAELLGEAYGYHLPGISIDIKNSDINIIKKYHALDEHGKDMVDMVLSKEYERVLHLQQTAVSAPAADTVSFPAHLVVNAAHADENSTAKERQSDDDMMMDDSEWE